MTHIEQPSGETPPFDITDDWCSLCGGNGCEYGCGHRYHGCKSAHLGPNSHRICRKCRGSGRVETGGGQAGGHA